MKKDDTNELLRISVSEARRQLCSLDMLMVNNPIIYVTRHNRPEFAIVDCAYLAAMLKVCGMGGEND